MYFKRISSISTDRIVTASNDCSPFDIELQHPQPRRRQTFDLSHQVEPIRDENIARAYSIPRIQEKDILPRSDHLQTIPNMLSIPSTALATTSIPYVIGTSSPAIVEEK